MNSPKFLSVLKHRSKGQKPRPTGSGQNEVFAGLTGFFWGPRPPQNTHRYHPCHLLAFDVKALFDLFMLRTGSGASRRPAVPLVTPPRRDSTTGQMGGNENLYGPRKGPKILGEFELHYCKLFIF